MGMLDGEALFQPSVLLGHVPVGQEIVPKLDSPRPQITAVFEHMQEELPGIAFPEEMMTLDSRQRPPAFVPYILERRHQRFDCPRCRPPQRRCQ